MGVCAWMIEALKNDYDVTFITHGQPLDIKKLNKFYGTTLSQDEFRIIHLCLPTLLTRIPWFPKPLSIAFAFTLRWAKKNAHQFSLMIGIDGECDFGRKGLQYIHFPLRNAKFLSKSYGVKHPFLRRLIHIFLCWISGFTKEGAKRNLTLVNSNWVAELVKEGYGIEPLIVYPPIKIDFKPRPWGERENGFILIGRIEKVKQVLRVIEIIKRLKKGGYDVHLHIVGKGKGRYAKKVFALTKEDSSLFLEQGISRKKLSELICSHKYGIHGHKFEHFGMVIAEMITGGCIVFLPNGGGQVEIVNGRKDVLYNSVEDAVEKIKRVLDDEKLQQDIQKNLVSDIERFSTIRFETQVREIVKGFFSKE